MKIKMINLGSTLLGVDQGLVSSCFCNRCDCVLVLQEPQSKDDRPTTSVTYTAPETTNLGSPNMDTRRAGQYSALG